MSIPLRDQQHYRVVPRAICLAVLALLIARSTHAQAADPFVMAAVRATSPPAIDGVVDAREWEGAARGERFIQFEPNRGAASTFETVVMLFYDEGHLYVAFQAWDAEPLMSQMTQRDADLWNDDSVQIYLDSFYDRRSGYMFMTNVLGTQADGRVAEDGVSVDNAWDAAWQSATRATEFGWSAEFAIPFSSIKYASGESTTWGINFSRTRRRTFERSYWAGPVDHWGRMSQAGSLVGLNVAPPTRRHQFIPYALSRSQESRSPVGAVGFDLRYALTAQTAIYATANPDFATVEADQELINLTRFEVSLVEKRQFFLEGGELFNQRIRTFYSRRIADISAGGKLLGRQDKWSVALLSAQGQSAGSSDAAHFTVARVQRDVASRSNIGFTSANRASGDRHQGSVELDSNLFFTPTVGFTGQLIKSYGQYGRGGLAFFVRPSYDSATGHFHVRYTHLGDRLADNINLIGFVQDDDRRELDSAVQKTVWISGGMFERIGYNSNYSIYWGQTGVLRSWQVDEVLAIDFRNRWSLGLSQKEEFKRFEKDFRNRQSVVELGYNTRAYQSVRAGLAVGRNFDADFLQWIAAARYKLTPELSAEYELQQLWLDPDPRGEGTWIHVIRASHSFTPDLFLKVFFQTNSAIDRRNLQAVFVYRYLPPFGTLQVAYQRGTAEFGQRSEQGHTLFVKVTTVL